MVTHRGIEKDDVDYALNAAETVAKHAKKKPR
jgi:hypothetical protein